MRRRAQSVVGLWASAAWLCTAACFDPLQSPPCSLLCSPANVCPSGQVCGDDAYCYPEGTANLSLCSGRDVADASSRDRDAADAAPSAVDAANPGTPDAIDPVAADARPGTPDARPGTPDARPGTPDAGPTPDARPPIDAAPTLCERAAGEPVTDSCATARDLTTAARRSGGVTIAGDTTLAFNNEPSPTSCGLPTHNGPNILYRINNVAGDHVTVIVTPEATFDVAVQMERDVCAGNDCIGSSDQFGAGGSEGFSTTLGGTHFITVDSASRPGGCYEIFVQITQAL